MQLARSLPATATFRFPRRWWIAPAAIIALVNAVLMVNWMGYVLTGPPGVDWVNYVASAGRFFTGDLYDYGVWHYSPFLAPLFAVMPEAMWRYLHFVALLALPGRWLPLIVLVSWPFWVDVIGGNLMIFVLVAAVWALRGNVWGIGATLAIAILIPRPLMLPLVAWIWWKHPTWRWPFVAMFAVHALAVVATGWAPAWIADLLTASSDVANPFNGAPSQVIGMAWMLVAVPLSAVAFWRGRPALSGFLLQPYWLPYYLLMPMADFTRRSPETSER